MTFADSYIADAQQFDAFVFTEDTMGRQFIDRRTPDPNNLQPGECGGTSCPPEYEEMLANDKFATPVFSGHKVHPFRQTGGGHRVIRKTNTF